MRYVFAILVLAGAFTGSAARAQSPAPPPPDTLLDAVEFGGRQRQALIIASADLMNDADYAFRPTPEIRTFGQVVAHVADLNYLFCAQAKGERPPVAGIEKASKSRDELRTALRESYAYCESVGRGLTPETQRRMVKFGKTVTSAATIMEVVTLHNIHMYGTMVVYLRLRGKVPPPMI